MFRFVFVMQRALTSEERLEILREADHNRKWVSLDDQRACGICNRVFSGRQIAILRDQRGRFLLKCPTADCRSYMPDWLYTGNAIRVAV
jgi:hypothetical protein